VPAGEVSWQADAATLPQPWPESEVQLVDRLPSLSAAALAAVQLWEQVAHMVAAAQLEQQQMGPLVAEQLVQQLEQQMQHLPAGPAAAGAGGGDGPSSSSSSSATGARGQPHVAAVHTGVGRVAGDGFQHPEWVPGRLWQLSDGRIAFLWQEAHQEEGFLIEYERLQLTPSSCK